MNVYKKTKQRMMTRDDFFKYAKRKLYIKQKVRALNKQRNL